MLKALAKDPAFRYQSAREMYIDLAADRPATRFRGEAVSTRRAARGRVARVPPWASGTSTGADAHGARSGGNDLLESPAGPADEWIGSGIAETVTSDLKNVKGIIVIGRAQVFDAARRSQRRERPPSDRVWRLEIGRRIGATWIVSGAFQRSASRADHGAVPRGRLGQVLRTVKVDGRLDAIFDLQDRIVFELSQGLQRGARRLGDRGDRARRDAARSRPTRRISRGMINLRDGEPRLARPGDRPVRARRDARSRLRRGVDGPGHGLEPQGRVPGSAGSRRAGGRAPCSRPWPCARARHRACAARARPSSASGGTRRRWPRRARRYASSRRCGRTRDAGAHLLVRARATSSDGIERTRDTPPAST